MISNSVFSQDQKKTADENLIKAKIQMLMDGWNTKSGKLFAAPFAEHADYVVINGDKIKGREVIDRGHQHIFDTIYKDTKIDLEMEQIRFLKEDIAIVHVKGKRTGTSFGKLANEQARITLVLAKNNGEWWIEAFQNTNIEPPRKPENAKGN